MPTEPSPVRPNDRRRELAVYAAAVVLAVLLVAWLMDLPHADLRVPFKYAFGDTLQVQMWVKGLLDNPWLLHNDYLGGPGGQDMHDFPTSDALHFLMLKLLALATGDPFLAINLFFLLTFPLTAVTALFVLRDLGVSRGPALLAALLYALLPYHFLRGVGHLFLASYWILPLLAWLALRVYLDRGPFWKWDEAKGRPVSTWRSWGALAALLVCAVGSSTGVYYAYFGCFLLLVAGATAALARKMWYPLISAGVLTGVLAAGVVANVAPMFVYAGEHGRNPKAVDRVALNAELAGLKITYLLLPVDHHRLPPLARARRLYDQECHAYHLPTNAAAGSLGALGALGFVFLVGRGLLVRDRGGPTLPGGLALFNLACLLLATLGGFGAVLGLAGARWIRGYERISVVIAFLALAALALLLQSTARRWLATPRKRWLFRGGLAALLLLGALDQTAPGCWFGPYPANGEEFASDATFIAKVEAAVPPHSLIFQLPFVEFPEVKAPQKMMTYDHARGYLHSRTLRWSYGSMKGRPASEWQKELAALPPAEMVQRLREAGFRGVYVDRFGYADHGAALEAELTRLLGPPRAESPNRRLVYFDFGETRPVTG